MRVVVSATIVVSLQFSVCTGGLLSVSSAMATSITDTENGVNMTAVSADSFLCQMFTPINELETASNDNGCQQGETCMKQSQRSVVERSVALFSSGMQTVVSAVQDLLHENSLVFRSPKSLARAGPMYEESSLLAHVLLKRE